MTPLYGERTNWEGRFSNGNRGFMIRTIRLTAHRGYSKSEANKNPGGHRLDGSS